MAHLFAFLAAKASLQRRRLSTPIATATSTLRLLLLLVLLCVLTVSPLADNVGITTYTTSIQDQRGEEEHLLRATHTAGRKIKSQITRSYGQVV